MAVEANPEIDPLPGGPRGSAPPPEFVARSNAQPDLHERTDRYFEGFWVQLSERVAQKIGAITRPKHSKFTPEHPETRSGMSMRRLLRDIADTRLLGNVTTVAGAGIVGTIRDTAAASDADQLV